MSTRRPMKDAAFHLLTLSPVTRAEALRLAYQGHGTGPAMQLVDLVCPNDAGHTLGLVITDDTGALRIESPRDPDGPRLTRDGPQLVYACHPCRRAGTGRIVGRVPLANVLDVSAALAWAHDPSQPRPLRAGTAATATRHDLRRTQSALLSDYDDAHRAERRAFRALLVTGPDTP